MKPLQQRGRVTSWSDVMFWQGWLVGNGIMLSVPLLPSQEGWVGAFSHKAPRNWRAAVCAGTHSMAHFTSYS